MIYKTIKHSSTYSLLSYFYTTDNYKEEKNELRNLGLYHFFLWLSFQSGKKKHDSLNDSGTPNFSLNSSHLWGFFKYQVIHWIIKMMIII